MLQGTNYGTMCDHTAGFSGIVIMLQGTIAQCVIMLEDTNWHNV
jgi:hypothetical protein